MKTQDESGYVAQVAEARRSAGMSQAEVARRMTELGHAWHQTTAAKVESEDRGLRLGEAMSLSAIFGVPLPGSPQPERRAQVAAEIAELTARVKQLADSL